MAAPIRSGRACCSSKLGGDVLRRPDRQFARGAVDDARPAGRRSARPHRPPIRSIALLTPAGRAALARTSAAAAASWSTCNRAADIRQLLRWAQRHNVRIAIAGGAEAWKLRRQLAAAKVPVFVDALADLPGGFRPARRDAGERRAPARGRRGGRASRSRRCLAQRAQDPPDRGQCGGQRPALGRRPGRPDARAGAKCSAWATSSARSRRASCADLVLWSGDPLDVSQRRRARCGWAARAMPMRSRQTELRDRYLRAAGALPRAYSP